MKILDLDLDFFIDDIRIEYLRCEGRFNTSSPWTEMQVISFLEDQCGLSKDNRVPGRIVSQHHEAFFFWRELIQNNSLQSPFELVHVDAHSDMGYADLTAMYYIMGELLHKPVKDRINIDSSKINCGNYIVFAAACRWLSNVMFVTHPKWHDDLSRFYFKEGNTNSNALQLRKYNNPHVLDFGQIELPVPAELEPEIPFTIIKKDESFNVQDFSYIILSHSPEYTPESADSLLEIFKEYIIEI